MACSKADEKKFEGGYELKTVDEDKDLECSICLMLLREAMGTPCSHAFCRVCLQKLIGQEDIRGATFKCPDCQQPVDSDKVYPIAFVDRLVRRSDVYCSRKDEGCEWTGTLASFIQQHNSDCSFRIVQCVYEGCVFSGIKLKIKEHESNCEYRMVQCEHCQAELKVKLLEMQKHLDQDCMFVVVSCSYAKFGCLEKVLRKYLDRHNETATNRHMVFMCDQLLQCRSKNQDLQNEIDQLKTANSEIPKLKNEVEHLNATNKEIPKLQNEIKELREELNRYFPSFQLHKLLLRGLEKWVMKNDNIIMERGYTEWCKKIFVKTEENRLYQFDTSMLVRFKNIEAKKIYWFSNGKEQDEACNAKDVYYRGDNRYVLKHNQFVFIETETLDSFNSNNSKMLVLHPSDSENIISETGFEMEGYNGWEIKLSGDFYVDGFVIVCLVKM